MVLGTSSIFLSDICESAPVGIPVNLEEIVKLQRTLTSSDAIYTKAAVCTAAFV
jgi:hypothetical protein